MRDQERVDVGKGIKEKEREKRKTGVDSHQMYGVYTNKISVLVKAIKKGRLLTPQSQGRMDT